MTIRSKPVSGLSTVYRADNKVTGDFYIGITNQYLSKRRSKHRGSAINENSQTHFHRAIRKYGWENFTFSAVLMCESYDEAKASEVRLIEELNPTYNMTKGGDGCEGYKHTPEECIAISKRNTGRPGFWKGKKLPPHVVDMMRARGKKRPDKEQVLKLGPKAIQRAVICLDDGNEFCSGTAAAKHYGINQSQILQVCAKKPIRISAGGLVFRFVGEDHGGKEEADRVRAESRKRRFTRKKPHYMKPVLCLTDNLEFKTVKDAAKHYGMSPDKVRKSCRGLYKYEACEKIVFRYLKDIQNEIAA